MTDTGWIGLATLAFLIVSAVCTYAARKLAKIDLRVETLGSNIDATAKELNNKMVAVMNAHEQRDQERHVENVERLTRLETMVMNGHARKKVRVI